MPISARTRLGATVAASIVLATLPGCYIGGMIENYKRTSTHSVEAQYEGLAGKSFAVVVTANRSIESDVPGVTDRVLERVTEELAKNAGASGVVPGNRVRLYLLDHPSWQAMQFTDLAKELGGVQRLVYIELQDFRLTDPGNRYEWAGVGAGNVAVIELDGVDPDAFVFEKQVRVAFPDKKGFTPENVQANVISSELVRRFVDRASWLFYKHEEPYYPEY